MKKLLLSLGAIASVAAPVAAVVACGSTTPDVRPTTPDATTVTLADIMQKYGYSFDGDHTGIDAKLSGLTLAKEYLGKEAEGTGHGPSDIALVFTGGTVQKHAYDSTDTAEAAGGWTISGKHNTYFDVTNPDYKITDRWGADFAAHLKDEKAVFVGYLQHQTGSAATFELDELIVNSNGDVLSSNGVPVPGSTETIVQAMKYAKPVVAPKATTSTNTGVDALAVQTSTKTEDEASVSSFDADHSGTPAWTDVASDLGIKLEGLVSTDTTGTIAKSSMSYEQVISDVKLTAGKLTFKDYEDKAYSVTITFA